MPFGDESWDSLLPSYLSDTTKGRLKEALEQFKPLDRKEISYDRFYKNYEHGYFLQGDLIIDIRVPIWDKETRSFSKGYSRAIILSNTCDLSFENKRSMNSKQCLFAPVIYLEDFLSDLSAAGYDAGKLEEFTNNARAQLHSNIFFLPRVNEDDKDQIALLDRIFWFPIEELKGLIESIEEERVCSLDHFGYYLFVLKLSYHLCRLPEQCDRELSA